MKKIGFALTLAIACIGLCAWIAGFHYEKDYQNSREFAANKHQLFQDIDDQIIKQLKVAELVKSYRVTDTDIQRYRDELFTSEDDRAEDIKAQYDRLLSYKMSLKQKEELKKQRAESLAFNKKLYHDDAYVRKILLKQNRKELQNQLENFRAPNDIQAVYRLENIKTGDVLTNETAQDKPTKFEFKSTESHPYKLGDFDYYDETYFNYISEDFKNYVGTVYISTENEPIYFHEATYHTKYVFLQWLKWLGIVALAVAIYFSIATRKQFKPFGRRFELQLLAALVIIAIGLLIGASFTGALDYHTNISDLYYKTAMTLVFSTLLIYMLLHLVYSIIYTCTRHEWKKRSWIGRNQTIFKNSFYEPRQAFLLLFSWLAFFLAGLGMMIISMDGTRELLFVYFFLWLVVMFPTMFIAWRNMAATNTVIRQTEQQMKPLQGQFPLAKHSQRIASLEAGVNHSYAEQQKSERMKTELITNVSHDLRTPLTAMMTYTDLLKNPALTADERKEYVDVLDLKTQKLKVLIDDLFDVSKMASGQLELHKASIDYVQMVQQLVGEQQELAEARHLTIRTQFDTESYPITVDAAKWARMIDNLIGNAIKYSTEHTRIHVQLQNGTLTIKNVTAFELPEDLDELMDRFTRGDDSRHTEGSGLGLAIAQSIANLHGTAVTLQVDGDLFKATIKAP